MIESVAEFSRLASAASKKRAGFQVTQVTECDGLRIEAAVRRAGPRSIRVEYRTYQNPWTELEETLSGQVEFTGKELCGLVIQCDGPVTWIYDPSTNTVIRKLGSHLFEPILGLATLGELAFLDTLTQDFLLRDRGEQSTDGHVLRCISVKPKQAYRSQLLSAVTFPIDGASIDFDTETFFPMHISVVPSKQSPAASILGPGKTLRITYKDMQLLTKAEPDPFSPPADARLFTESLTPVQELADAVPFPMQLRPLFDHGFEAAESPARLTLDADMGRAFATAHFSTPNSSSGEDTPAARLTLCTGNYMSRNMARRRTAFSEMGDPSSAETSPVRLLDRSTLWQQRLPGIDTQHAPVEAFFEKSGVYWFLSGAGMELDLIEALAHELFEANDEAIA